jgi:hypothetical protein
MVASATAILAAKMVALKGVVIPDLLLWFPVSRVLQGPVWDYVTQTSM